MSDFTGIFWLWSAISTSPALQLLITSMVVIAGWYIAHWLSARRDVANKRREIRTAGLRGMYMALAVANQRDLKGQMARDLEDRISEVQLYGNDRIVELLGQLVVAFTKPTGSRISYDPLLKELRDQIRADLALSKIDGEVWWLRIADRAQNVVPPETTTNQPPVAVECEKTG